MLAIIICYKNYYKNLGDWHTISDKTYVDNNLPNPHLIFVRNLPFPSGLNESQKSAIKTTIFDDQVSVMMTLLVKYFRFMAIKRDYFMTELRLCKLSTMTNTIFMVVLIMIFSAQNLVQTWYRLYWDCRHKTRGR